MKWTRTWGVSLALALSACAGMAVAPPRTDVASPAPIDAKLMQARRAFAAAEIEWQSAIAVGRALVRHDAIKGETANTVRGWNAEARKVIVNGKAATDAAAKAAAAAELLRLTGLLDRITGRK